MAGQKTAAALDAFVESVREDLVKVVTAWSCASEFDANGETVYCAMLERTQAARFYVVKQGHVGFPLTDDRVLARSRGVTEYACSRGVKEYIYFGSIALREDGAFNVTIEVDRQEAALIIPPANPASPRSRSRQAASLNEVGWSGDRRGFKLYSLTLPGQHLLPGSPDREPQRKSVGLRSIAKGADVIWLGIQRATVLTGIPGQ